LSIALVIEAALAFSGFFAPSFALRQFGIADSPETQFLSYVVAWLLLFVTVICGWALHRVHLHRAAGLQMSLVLGLWWVGVGSALFLRYDKVENLFLDAFKGALIVAAAIAEIRKNGQSYV
jgi:hypothetical protein